MPLATHNISKLYQQKNVNDVRGRVDSVPKNKKQKKIVINFKRI